ncbi:UDP-N-acetylmuramoyl-tripeptide--D-alanyl-D-alanine ligase [Falsiroseomonas sp.]|uniref:UDP-N-acetylmuramoyl-tripeptide--D-alanyl-D- alanine ligase n=1 Tax=Falsiroseomonas sp. TaxID=2870721 RepID=UPI002736A6D8|nr:UDP-N-acetylmuramoyl-tripeptide--D-alanyl-D-alanine ligase [Falsiroseomonas sp.]MDP3417712.1 UDP-N-acetylmuramoyl-tripeptide--D-alanyl-D-alanine ligase [Falsiroseomonas sp.]
MSALWTSAELRASTGGTLVADVAVTGVSIDSRSVTPGDLFVALRDARDGHGFVADALARGAAAALVDHVPDGVAPDSPLLRVAETLAGLRALGEAARARSSARVVGVTGSVGKTTTKEMLRALLSEAGATHAAVASYNNHWGVPLTLARMPRDSDFAIIEMGMNHPGEIAYLSRIARPDVALIINAQAAHLAGFPHLNPLPQAGEEANVKGACFDLVEAVARAKGEIFQGLAANGIAVINADDPHAALWQELATGHRLIRFGLKQQAEVSASFKLQPFGSEIEVVTPAGKFAVALPVPGEHNVRNALAATAVAQALGVGNATVAAGLAKVSSVKGRLLKNPCLHGATLIDDTYNANPGSVRAAIAVLAGMPGKKVLVLGDMGELGENARALHAEIGAAAKAAGIDLLFTLGDLSAAAAQAFGAGGRHFEYIEDLLHDIENLLAPEVTVLVKGSRFMQMERVVKSFEVRGEA